MEIDAPFEALTDRPARRRAERRFMHELEHPSDAFRHIGPNWFASVMGTGIVANAAILLPRQVAGQRGFALGVWILAASLLVILVGATAAHWVRHPDRARGHLSNPAMAPFYGAPAMALLTVGAGTLLVGQDLIGLHAAVVVDSVLWGLGTVLGLIVCIGVPTLMFRRGHLDPHKAFATWLMPIVPPMVSAATGAALIEHLPTHGLQLAMLLACYAMFGLSLVLAVATIVLVIRFRLGRQEVDPPELVPTLWIVLGPLGQSVTAVGLLGVQASGGIVGEPFASIFGAMETVYGFPVWAFALGWLGLVAVITIKTARRRLPFSLTWWSFTFPVGTVVTGTSVLATRTGAAPLAWIAVGLYAFLVCAWATALGNTLRGAWSGSLFIAPDDVDRGIPSRPTIVRRTRLVSGLRAVALSGDRLAHHSHRLETREGEETGAVSKSSPGP